MREPNVIFDNDLLEGTEIESVIISPLKPDIGITILSSVNRFTNKKLVYLYSISWNKYENAFTVFDELQTFSFNDHVYTYHFI
ncbi:hypothetical protein [Peribacillus sp. SCS-155]|uniref:hypothetical protein n=1 Tax=Peribacillus sedimenti TaxID=3115297 RepID=UPI0039069A3E